MPAAANNTFDAQQFAHLVGLLDSPLDAEAAGALHKIRLALKKRGVKFYEAVENDDYKTAAWQKLGGCATPCEAGAACHHGPECLRGYFEGKHGGGAAAELIEAQEKAAAYAREAREVMAQLTDLAETVKSQEDTISELRQELAGRPSRASDTGLVNGYLVAVVVLIGLGLMITALCQFIAP